MLDIGGGAPLQLVSRSQDPTHGVQRAIQVVSIKNTRFKCQPSIHKCNPLYQKKHTFLEIDDKREEISTKISLEVGFGHGYGQRRGSNIEKLRMIKILGQEKHTSRGSKPMNFDWLHLRCAYSCACLHCISFKFDKHACMLYASCRI